MTVRQELVECLEFARDVERLYIEISSRQQQIVSMRSEENRLDNRKGLFRNICLITLGFCVMILGMVLTTISNTGSIITMLPIIILIILTIVISCILHIRTAKKLRNLKYENSIRQPQIEASVREFQSRMQQLVDYGYEEGYFDIVPRDYFNTEMLEYCISVIDRKLATTHREAFMLLEQELQRREQMMQQQMWYDAQSAQMDRLTNAVERNTMATLLANQQYRR